MSTTHTMAKQWVLMQHIVGVGMKGLSAGAIKAIKEKMRLGIDLSADEFRGIAAHFKRLEVLHIWERKIVQAALRRVSAELVLQAIEGSDIAVERLAQSIPEHLLDVIHELAPDGNWDQINVLHGDLFAVVDEDGLVGEHTATIYRVLRDALDDDAAQPGEARFQVIDQERGKRYVEFIDPDEPEHGFVFAIEADGGITVVTPASSDIILQIRLVDEF